MTACGNFGLVGFERHDSVVMWNMQSGIKRREFKFATGKQPAGLSSKRSRHVTGIETDSLNTITIVATLGGDVHVSSVSRVMSIVQGLMKSNLRQFFDFHAAKYLESIALPAGIESTQLQRDNNLLACVCDDLTVRLVDIETKRTVREFSGFRGRIVDMVRYTSSGSGRSRRLVTDIAPPSSGLLE